MTTLQDHIHMDFNVSADAELAPILRWRTSDRIEVPQVIGTTKRTVEGKLKWHVSGDENGVHRFTIMRYSLKLIDEPLYTKEEMKEFLLQMHGQFVWLVDHFHCADGQDHTPYMMPYLLESIGEFVPVSVREPYFRVDVELQKATLDTTSVYNIYWPLGDTTYGAIGSTARL